MRLLGNLVSLSQKLLLEGEGCEQIIGELCLHRTLVS